MKKLSFLVSVFIKITTCVELATAFFATVWNGSKTVDSVILWQIPLVSFLCTISTLIYSGEKNMRKAEWVIRVFLHYIIINVIVLGSGHLFCWYDIESVGSVFAMIIVIALIFAIVSISSWKKSYKEAEQMNEKLKKQFR